MRGSFDVFLSREKKGGEKVPKNAHNSKQLARLDANLDVIRNPYYISRRTNSDNENSNDQSLTSMLAGRARRGIGGGGGGARKVKTSLTLSADQMHGWSVGPFKKKKKNQRLSATLFKKSHPFSSSSSAAPAPPKKKLAPTVVSKVKIFLLPFLLLLPSLPNRILSFS